MTRVEYEDIKDCDDLVKAYNLASANAYNKISRPSNVDWDTYYYGNFVSSKGCVLGLSSCARCGKRVRLTFQFLPIEGWAEGHEPVRIYYTGSSKIAINVSGQKCSGIAGE